MEIRTDRVGVLIDPLEESLHLSRDRVADMSDDEYLWEPVPGMWSLRPTGATTTPNAYGGGEWKLDHNRIDPFAPGPLTTIAWRLNHLLSGITGRWEWTFGSRSIDPRQVVDFSPLAGVTLAALWSATERWTASIEKMTDEQLDVPGFGQYPLGLDPQLPFIGIVRWVNREFIHHMAEVAMLRDLYLCREDLKGAC
jgi:hypothetical protein